MTKEQAAQRIIDAVKHLETCERISVRSKATKQAMQAVRDAQAAYDAIN